MPPRVRRNHRQEPDVQLGGADPLSQLAHANWLPLCGVTHVDIGLGCTRARGHDEDPGSKHVYANKGVVQMIWEDAP